MTFRPVGPDEAAELAQDGGLESAVGHVDTAALFTEQLGVPVPVSRVTVVLGDCSAAVLGAYRGPRLPEGTTTLPAGATIAWYYVEVDEVLPPGCGCCR